MFPPSMLNVNVSTRRGAKTYNYYNCLICTLVTLLRDPTTNGCVMQYHLALLRSFGCQVILNVSARLQLKLS